MTFFTFLRFTKQQNMLQQQLKEATVGKKLSRHSHIWNSSESILGLTHKGMNYFCLTRFVGFWLKYMLKDNVDRSSQVYFPDSNNVAVELLPSCSFFLSTN